jgi:hypothetical protein
MLKKLNQYLLTHHPLLWNTRVLHVLAANALIHLLFFAAGYASLSAGTAMYRYSYYAYEPGIIMFSVLCSFVVLILWLVFYLRNNAFKSFYTIGKNHLVKEMLIVLVILFTSIIFFESYHAGTRAKGRSITGSSLLVKEVNTVNLAMAFMPFSKSDYFILNTCEKNENGTTIVNRYDNFDTLTKIMAAIPDSASDEFNEYNYRTDSIEKAKRAALRKPGAISYLHYCRQFIMPDDSTGIMDNARLKATINRWIKNGRKDSIKNILTECFAVCKKYNVDFSMDAAVLARLPFADSLHTVNTLLGTSEYESDNQGGGSYINNYQLSQSLEFIESCQTGKNKYINESLLPELYVMLFAGLVIICYRRFSKKVFFISLVGAAIWCIFFALLGAASASVNAVAVLFLFLFLLFTIISLLQLKTKSQKTITGILLNWHIYTIPIVLIAIAGIIAANYEAHTRYTIYDNNLIDNCRQYPFSCWVSEHFETIAWGNLAFSLLYSIFIVNLLTKKWHVLPEE